MNNLKIIFLHILLYEQNEGKPPSHLNDLIGYSPDVVGHALEAKQLIYISEYDQRRGDYIYYPPHANLDQIKAESIILASPFRAKNGEKRLILQGHGDVELVDEDKFQRIIDKQ